MSKQSLGVVLWLLIFPFVSRADVEALNYSGGSPQSFPGYTVVWEFSVSSAVDVTSLGWFDGGSVLSSSHDVGIYKNDGTLLASAVVSPSDPVLGSVNYDSIATLSLSPGDYVIAGTSGSDTFQAFCDSVTTASDVSYLGGLYIANPSLTFPTTPSDRGVSYFGPDFTFADAPEPSALSLLIISGVGLGFMWLTNRTDARQRTRR